MINITASKDATYQDLLNGITNLAQYVENTFPPDVKPSLDGWSADIHCDKDSFKFCMNDANDESEDVQFVYMDDDFVPVEFLYDSSMWSAGGAPADGGTPWRGPGFIQWRTALYYIKQGTGDRQRIIEACLKFVGRIAADPECDLMKLVDMNTQLAEAVAVRP